MNNTRPELQLNPVQRAYYDYLTLDAEFKRVESFTSVEAQTWFNRLAMARRAIWYQVEDLTREVNPSLKADIDKGNYDQDLGFTSTMNYLENNWEISKAKELFEHTRKDPYLITINVRVGEAEYTLKKLVSGCSVDLACNLALVGLNHTRNLHQSQWTIPHRQLEDPSAGATYTVKNYVLLSAKQEHDLKSLLV